MLKSTSSKSNKTIAMPCKGLIIKYEIKQNAYSILVPSFDNIFIIFPLESVPLKLSLNA